jgi:monoamine oxidase
VGGLPRPARSSGAARRLHGRHDRRELRLRDAHEPAQQFLGQIEPVLPGISQYWNGKATVDFWAGYPWTLGSYSYWKVGQYTKFSGAEGERSGACHFAGEHTSVDFQGYLNGAVESGERAASEILADLKH